MTWKKGQTGNPGGRPKRDILTQHLIAELNEIDAEKNVTKARALIQSLVANAVAGDLQAQREIYDRVEGKPVQTNENYNYSEVSRLSDDDIARLLSERLLNGGAGAGVPTKTNGATKPH